MRLLRESHAARSRLSCRVFLVLMKLEEGSAPQLFALIPPVARLWPAAFTHYQPMALERAVLRIYQRHANRQLHRRPAPFLLIVYELSCCQN
jgi:hypothetical protein